MGRGEKHYLNKRWSYPFQDNEGGEERQHPQERKKKRDEERRKGLTRVRQKGNGQKRRAN